MDTRTAARLARVLRQCGTFPDAQPWELAAAVQAIVDDIDRRTDVTRDEAECVSRALRNHRHYDLARTVAQCWRSAKGFDAAIDTHLAQSLINLGSLDDAQKILEQGLPELKRIGGNVGREKTPEFEGLLGRILKQRFVISGNAGSLGEARARYLETFTEYGLYWHGINATALRAREERAGYAASGLPTAADLAAKVLPLATSAYVSSPGDAFSAATASEACLALGDCQAAEFWLYRFLHHPAVKPFDIESYTRQLREIWQANPLNPGDSGADRLSRILSAHTARTEKRAFFSPADMAQARQGGDTSLYRDASELEKNFANLPTFSVENIQRLLEACESVGCVMNDRGARLGTGFLLDGSMLGEAGLVFVTNAHVISREVPRAIPPEKAFVTFEMESAAAGRPLPYPVEPGNPLFTSPPGDLGIPNPQTLDVTVVRLKQLPANARPLATARNLPLIQGKAMVYVVGHPSGSGLQISLQDSRLLDIDDDEYLLHYRTPTDPGSSGSPVFNSDWQVIALHHAGSRECPRLHGTGTYEANEGISLATIAQAMRKRAGAS